MRYHPNQNGIVFANTDKLPLLGNLDLPENVNVEDNLLQTTSGYAAQDLYQTHVTGNW